MKITRRVPSPRTFDPRDRRLLRFADGLVIDPADCPRSIHARKHWTPSGCRCNENATASSAGRGEPGSRASCEVSGSPSSEQSRATASPSKEQAVAPDQQGV